MRLFNLCDLLLGLSKNAVQAIARRVQDRFVGFVVGLRQIDVVLRLFVILVGGLKRLFGCLGGLFGGLPAQLRRGFVVEQILLALFVDLGKFEISFGAFELAPGDSLVLLRQTQRSLRVLQS